MKLLPSNLSLLVTNTFALADNTLFSLYQLNSQKSDANSGNTSNGVGFYYDTEIIKIRLEKRFNALVSARAIIK